MQGFSPGMSGAWVSEGIFQDTEQIGLLSQVAFKDDRVSVNVSCALMHTFPILNFIHLSCSQENNSVLSSFDDQREI